MFLTLQIQDHPLKTVTYSIIALVAIALSSGTVFVYAEDIPAWVKNIAGFWADDQISDTEYANSISFLIDQQIIEVESVPVAEQELTCSDLSESMILLLAAVTVGKASENERFISSITTESLEFVEDLTDYHGIKMNSITEKILDNKEYYETQCNISGYFDLVDQLDTLRSGSSSTTTSSGGDIVVNTCGRDQVFGTPKVTGKYTSDGDYYLVGLTFSVLDEDGSVLGTYPHNIRQVTAGETRDFSIISYYDGEFNSCSVEVSNKFKDR